MRSNAVLQLVCGLAIVAGAERAPASAPDFEVVAMTGTDGPYGPGIGPGVTFDSFAQWGHWINSAGDVYFSATASDGSSGVFVGRRTGLREAVAAEGDSAPGLPYVLTDIGMDSIGGEGGVRSRMLDDQGNLIQWCVWDRVNGQLHLVMRVGEPAPLTEGIITSIYPSEQSDAGLDTYSARQFVNGFGYKRTAWVSDSSGLRVLSKDGDNVPGLLGYEFKGPTAHIVLESTDPLLRAEFVNTATGGDGLGFWRETPAGLTLLMREAGNVPGVPGAKFMGTSELTLSVAPGYSAQAATARIRYDDSSEAEVAFFGQPGAMTPFAIGGEPAPGVGPDAFFRIEDRSTGRPAFDGVAAVDANTAFLVTDLTGPAVTADNDRTLFRYTHGVGVEVILREGDALDFDPELHIDVLASVLLKKNGSLVLEVLLDGPGVTSANDLALLTWDEQSGFAPLLREGDLIEIDATARTLETWAPLGGDFAPHFGALVHRRYLTDAGELSMRVELDGGDIAILRIDASVNAADLNGDGAVDGADLAFILALWGVCAPPCPADMNDDGVVDGPDLAAILAAWSP